MVYRLTATVAGIFSMNLPHTSWPTYRDSLTPQSKPSNDFCKKITYCSRMGLLYPRASRRISISAISLPNCSAGLFGNSFTSTKQMEIIIKNTMSINRMRLRMYLPMP